jgi:hypothetical protein
VHAWIATGAAVASAGFAYLTWRGRKADAKRHARKERLHRVLDALHEVSRDAFAARYGGANTLHSTKLRFGSVVQAAGESLPECSNVATAKSDLEIERYEQGAFAEIAQRLAESD